MHLFIRCVKYIALFSRKMISHNRVVFSSKIRLPNCEAYMDPLSKCHQSPHDQHSYDPLLNSTYKEITNNFLNKHTFKLNLRSLEIIPLIRCSYVSQILWVEWAYRDLLIPPSPFQDGVHSELQKWND